MIALNEWRGQPRFTKDIGGLLRFVTVQYLSYTSRPPSKPLPFFTSEDARKRSAPVSMKSFGNCSRKSVDLKAR